MTGNLLSGPHSVLLRQKFSFSINPSHSKKKRKKLPMTNKRRKYIWVPQTHRTALTQSAVLTGVKARLEIMGFVESPEKQGDDAPS